MYKFIQVSKCVHMYLAIYNNGWAQPCRIYVSKGASN